MALCSVPEPTGVWPGGAFWVTAEDVEEAEEEEEERSVCSRLRRKISTPTTGMAAAMQAHTARSKGAKREKMLIFSSGLRIRMPTL